MVPDLKAPIENYRDGNKLVPFHLLTPRAGVGLGMAAFSREVQR
jgi:hypothetical protein